MWTGAREGGKEVVIRTRKETLQEAQVIESERSR